MTNISEMGGYHCLRWVILLGVTGGIIRSIPAQDRMVSGNPAAVTSNPGSGQIGRWLGFSHDSGVQVGGMWLGDFNWLMGGGNQPGSTTWNSLLVVGVNADLEKLIGWDGARFGTQFLRFDGQNTNDAAGSVQGYNGLPGSTPLNRSELYQFWIEQKLFENRVQIRVGKVVPTLDFNNVLESIPVDPEGLALPAISGLLYTPIFVNPSLLGVIPGYYNSAWGMTLTAEPTEWLGLAYGIYDGRQAQGIQTGIEVWPGFDGAYFQILEVNGTWSLGSGKLLGRAGLGGWLQSGQLSAAGISEEGTGGVYAFASQTVWQGSSPRGRTGKELGPDQGIVIFWQFGSNGSKTLPINTFLGGGISAFGLIPGRRDDSFGIGAATSWLNPRFFERNTELMFQGYYQAEIVDGIFIEPALSYIPIPGDSGGSAAAWALTLRTTVLF